jgi:hypothetical protein
MVAQMKTGFNQTKAEMRPAIKPVPLDGFRQKEQ